MLDKNRFFVDPDIAKAETLPPEAFTSKEWLELEIEKVFKKFWLLVPVEPPKKSREWKPFELLGQYLFLVRDELGKLHCFPNVCTHKWSRLIKECGAGQKIVCPYHGRQFSLNGKFLSQPGFNKAGLKNFPRECDNLKEFPLFSWQGFLFLSLAANPIDPLRVFGDINRSLLPLADKIKKMKLAGSRKLKIKGHPLYHIDNYVDELHLRFVHGSREGLVDETKIESYETRLYEFSSLRWVYAKDPKDGFWHPGFKEPLLALWWHIFPNLTINVWDGGISLNSYLPEREDPGKTMLIIKHYVWDRARFAAVRKKWDKMKVDKEDLKIVGDVQDVIKYSYAVPGRFTPRGELACYWFQRLIYKMTRI